MKIIKGEKWFLVKWKNYADSDNTWEPESAFIEAKYMIKRMTPPQINNSTLCVSIQSSAFLSEDNLPDERPNEVVLTPPSVFAVSPRTPKLAVLKTPDATSRRSREVENEDTSVKLAFPHADSVAPVVEQQDPEHLSNKDIALIKSKIDDQFSNLFNRLQGLRSNAILNLLLVDTLLIGLNEASLADFFVIRAEFPFMPSWLINVLSKKKKLLNLMSLKVNTIFYMLGYDMLRMFKADTTEFVVNLMLRAINDFIGTVLVLDDEEEDGEERKMKTFVLITIPSIGILRDTIRVFNQGMHNELLKLRNEYKNKVTIELIDWENLVDIASKNESLSNINTVDDRIKLLFNEIETRFS
uniref:Chromo domain-containing protein n=1 Tax=Acrobeloides nanus TaxID=290746 RepID=A0A914D4R1_9BILA